MSDNLKIKDFLSINEIISLDSRIFDNYDLWQFYNNKIPITTLVIQYCPSDRLYYYYNPLTGDLHFKQEYVIALESLLILLALLEQIEPIQEE